jgi:hypothetical protein
VNESPIKVFPRSVSAGSHFLDEHEAVTNFLLEDVSVGYNQNKCKRKFIIGLN